MQQQVIVQGWYSGTITSWLYFRFQLMQLPKAIPACLPDGYPDIATLVVGHHVKSDGNGANGRITREGSTMPPPLIFFFIGQFGHAVQTESGILSGNRSRMRIQVLYSGAKQLHKIQNEHI